MNKDIKKISQYATGDLPVIVYIGEQNPIPVHSHEFEEIAIIIKGSAIHQINANKIPVMCGDVYVIRPGSEHTYLEPRSLSLVNILIHPQLFRKINKHLLFSPGYKALFELEPVYRESGESGGMMRLSEVQLSKQLQLISEIHSELTNKEENYEEVVLSLSKILITTLSRWYTEKGEVSHEKLFLISQISCYLEENYANEISVDEIADRAGISVTTLRRDFHALLGKSPSSYLLALRLKKSCEYLKASKYGMDEIGQLCGFHTTSYFIKRFSEKYGMTPGRWRKGAQ